MNKVKSKKGITLIALVITIIVLLILAAVSLSMLTGENGILNRAVTAKEETEHAKVKEQLQLELIDYEADRRTGSATAETSIDYLGEKGYLEGYIKGETQTSYVINHDKINGVSLGKGTIETGDVYVIEQANTEVGKIASRQESDVENKVKIAEEKNKNWILKYYYKVSEKKVAKELLNFEATGKITSGESGKTVGQLVEEGKIEVGDYVNYKPTSASSYISPQDKNGYADQELTREGLNWRVLSIDEEKITITTEKPTYKSLTLSGSVGWLNAESELNKVCEELYSNEYAKARSMNVDDVAKAAGVTFDSYTESTVEEIYYPDENGTETYNGMTKLSKGSYSHEQKNFSSDKIKDSASDIVKNILFGNSNNTVYYVSSDKKDSNWNLGYLYWLANSYYDFNTDSFGVRNNNSYDDGDAIMKSKRTDAYSVPTFLPFRPVVEISLDKTIKDFDKPEITSKTVGQLVEERNIRVGSYVNYKPTSNTYTSPQDKNGSTDQQMTTEDLNWRVLSIDEEKITITTEKPTYKSLTLSGSVGWLNAESELNKVCEELYSNEYGTARSMNVDDMAKAAGVTLDSYTASSVEEIYYPDENGTETYNGMTKLSKGSYSHEQKNFISYKIKDSASDIVKEILFGNSNNKVYYVSSDEKDSNLNLGYTYWLANSYYDPDKKTKDWFGIIVVNQEGYIMCGENSYVASVPKFFPIRPVVEISLDETIKNFDTPEIDSNDKTILDINEGDYVKYIDKSGKEQKCMVLNKDRKIDIVNISNIDELELGGNTYEDAKESYYFAPEKFNEECEKYLNTDYAISARLVDENDFNLMPDNIKNSDFWINETCSKSYSGFNQETFYIYGYYFCEEGELKDELIYDDGSEYDYYQVIKTHGVRIVYTLRLDLSIESGDGSEENPYILKGK